MSYFSEQDIDTRTCGQADEDAQLDRRDGYVRYTRPAIFAAMEVQRWNATQATQPLLTNEQQAQATYHAMRAAIDSGDLEAAKAHAIALRPLLGFMPKGN